MPTASSVHGWLIELAECPGSGCSWPGKRALSGIVAAAAAERGEKRTVIIRDLSKK